MLKCLSKFARTTIMIIIITGIGLFCNWPLWLYSFIDQVYNHNGKVAWNRKEYGVYICRVKEPNMSPLCLSVCEQPLSKSHGQNFMKFSGNVRNDQRMNWLNFGLVAMKTLPVLCILLPVLCIFCNISSFHEARELGLTPFESFQWPLSIYFHCEWLPWQHFLFHAFHFLLCTFLAIFPISMKPERRNQHHLKALSELYLFRSICSAQGIVNYMSNVINCLTSLIWK